METQKTVADWCERNFPGESREQMLEMLIEEATELSIAMGDITQEKMFQVIAETWQRLGHDRGNKAHIASGLADVQIALYDIASKVGMDAQYALDDKMAKNRKDIGA